MRPILIIAALAAMATTSASAQAQTSAPAVQNASAKHYTVKEATIGELIEDPAAKAVLDKHLPGFSTNDQIDMARGMTLKVVQQYAPGDITDEKLAAIDADLAKLPPKPAK